MLSSDLRCMNMIIGFLHDWLATIRYVLNDMNVLYEHMNVLYECMKFQQVPLNNSKKYSRMNLAQIINSIMKTLSGDAIEMVAIKARILWEHI